MPTLFIFSLLVVVSNIIVLPQDPNTSEDIIGILNLNRVSLHTFTFFSPIVRALLELLDVEDKFAELGQIKDPSNLREALTHDSIYSMKWKKWLTDEVDMSNLEALDDATKLQITELCGHYTFSNDDVAKEIDKLYENLAAIKIDGKRFVIEKLKEEMEKHVRCFNMEGLTTKIMNAED